jgi:gluconokinase
MHIPGLRSPHAKTGGIVYFGRMLDKIRLHAAGKLPPDYNTGTSNWWDFDARCTRFLGIDYDAVVQRTLRGGSDQSILQWCFREGRKPNEEEMEI